MNDWGAVIVPVMAAIVGGLTNWVIGAIVGAYLGIIAVRFRQAYRRGKCYSIKLYGWNDEAIPVGNGEFTCAR